MVTRKEILARKGNEWCRLEVTLSLLPKIADGTNGYRLAICGSAGYVVTRAQAKREALQQWESFFEDSPEELRSMGERFGKRFRTPLGGARFVVETDGEFHGLDVAKEEGKEVYLLTSCGQIREELLAYFPEVEPYFYWHLNDLRPSPATETAPAGASWVSEELPASVLEWFMSLQDGEVRNVDARKVG